VHVGGSGDGGVDGIGADANGKVIGLLQCKWAYWGEEVFSRTQPSHSTVRHILAALLHQKQVHPRDGIEFWPLSRVRSLVIKHAKNLPLALSLGVRS
jgi:hypothetical protein